MDSKTIGCGIFAVLFACFFMTSKCTFVGQTEIAFKYNVTSGKAVTSEENPLLTKGFHFSPFAWNTRFFSLPSEIQEYTFTAESTPQSPYNEALEWDSDEGVTMATDFTIRGRVLDPWNFYMNYGESEFDYNSVWNESRVHDAKLYEALRQAGQYAEQVMTEMTQGMKAEDIRVGRNDIKTKLIAEVRPYCEKFGFYIEDIIFPERFLYPDGNVIDEARQLLTDMNTKIRQEEQELENATAQKEVDMARATIEAQKISQEGLRVANQIDAETRALAEELKATIDQVGSEAAVRLKMAELNGRLTKAGVIKSAVLTKDSLLASPFYGDQTVTTPFEPKAKKEESTDLTSP